jgi:glycerol uptake facilitator-like aquaporin
MRLRGKSSNWARTPALERALHLVRLPYSNRKKEILSELVGTYLLVLIGPASIIITAAVPSLSETESLLVVAATFGGVVGAIIFVFGKHSGAIINPAICVASFVSRNLNAGLLAPYLLSQVVGGVAAGITLRVLFSPFGATHLGSTSLASGIGPLTGILIEAIGTFALATSALLAGNRLGKDFHKGLFVGATLFLLIIVIGPLTGASFNPARSLGPAIASTYLNDLYVYLIGPVIGGLAAGMMFRAVSSK